MQEQDNNLFSDLSFDDSAKKSITSIISWAMIIVVCAVVGYLLDIVGVFGSSSSQPQSEGFGAYLNVGGEGLGSVIFSIIIGLVLNYFLYRFATLAKKGLAASNVEQMGNGFRNLKIYFAIYSILVIIVGLLVLLAFVAIL